MKAEPNIKIVKGQPASETRTRRLKQPMTPPPGEVMSLISLENQEASRMDLHSLEEAQGLLEKLLFQVEEVKGQLEEIHQLQERCLVRLW